MTNIILAYISTAIVFAVIDLIWLGHIARNFYFSKIGELISFNIPAAVVFYVVYIAGILFFSVIPAMQAPEQGWKIALLLGACFGFFAYATYDLTNLATLKNWPLSLVMVDIAWGTFLTGSSALGGFLLTRWLIG